MFLHLQVKKERWQDLKSTSFSRLIIHPISKELLTIIIWAGAPYRKSYQWPVLKTNYDHN